MWRERWNKGEIYLSPSLKAHFATQKVSLRNAHFGKMQNATSRDCTFARSNQCENFRKSFFTLRNCFQSKYQNATSRDWFLRGVASAKIWQGEFSPCEISSTPPCSLRSTITWAYHFLHLRSHIHDWIFLSSFCICFFCICTCFIFWDCMYLMLISCTQLSQLI